MGRTGGSISGTVKDASGAVVPHAMVKATNTGTRVVYQAGDKRPGFLLVP